MITLAELVVKLLADADGYQKTFQEAEDRASGLGSHIAGVAGTIGKALGGALLAGGAALVTGLVASVGAAAEAEKGMAQLEAVIKSTGGKAGVTAEAALDLASSLQKVTMFEDDTVLSAENMLLTFTNIGKDVFPQATETALNLAQVMGGDVKGASIQLGKALNDPITGITALTRVGVTFTEAQKEQIKAMQESGDLMGAQKIVLAELATEFGGAARAAGQTFSGQLAILKNSLGDIMEEIGGRILPMITPLVARFKDFAIDALPAVSAALDVIVPKLVDGLGSVINFVVSNWGKVRDIVVGVFNDIVAWVNANIMPTIYGVIIPAFWAVVNFVVSNWPIVRDTILGVFDAVVVYTNTTLIPALLSLWNWVSSYWPMIRDVIVGAFWAVVEYVRGTLIPYFMGTLLPALQGVWAWIVAQWPMVRDTVIGVFNTVVAWIRANVVPFFNETVLPMFNRVVEWIQTNWGKIDETAQTVFGAVMSFINNTLLPFINGTLIPLFNRAVTWVTENWGKIGDTSEGVFSTVMGYINGTLLPFINNTLIPLFWSVVKWVETNWPKIHSTIEGVWNFLLGAYNTILKPVVDFIIERFQFVVSWVQENWPLIQKTIAKVVNWFKGDGVGGFNTFSNEIGIIFDTIKTIVTQAMSIIFGIVKIVMQLITGDTQGAGETLKKVFADIFWGALNIVSGIMNLMSEIVKGAVITMIDMLLGKGTAQSLASALGVNLNAKADILGGLGITKDGFYNALGVNTAPTSQPATTQINGMGAPQNTFIINTQDNPQAIAGAVASELRLQQVMAFAP